MADACVLGFSHILLFHNKSFACRPGIGNRDGENGWAKGEGREGKKRVGTIGAIKKDEEVEGRFTILRIWAEKILRWFSSISSPLLWRSLGRWKSWRRRFSREKSFGLENYRETSLGEPPLFYRESRDLWSGRCAPTPLSSSLLIFAARRWFIGSTGSWLGLGTFLSSMNRDMLDCFPRFRWYVFGISVDCERDKKLREEISYDMINRIVRFSFTLLIDKRNEKLCYLFN